ncbi:putative amidoligase [Hypoxylon sp. FL0543]|nr:putative amidoligase [Hypoxylon sp. FL0543]
MAVLTFGVELEAAYFYTIWPGEAAKANARDEDLAPVMDMSLEAIQRRNPEFPSHKFRDEGDMYAEMRSLVAETIRNFVIKLPETWRGKVIPSTDDRLQEQYRQWVVDVDNSIKVDTMRWPEYDDLWFAPLEVQSPAMYATPGAFREVEAVADMLTSRFRTAVNPSCGFHVHVGFGSESFPLDTLRRLAAVCWSGDLLFQQMHPMFRRNNEFCFGPRSKSRLGEGHKAEQYNPPSGSRPRSSA